MPTSRNVTRPASRVNSPRYERGALSQLARSLGVNRSLITRVLKGTATSARVSAALEQLRKDNQPC